MFSPEKQQIEICLLKLNLDEIINDLIAQRSAIPELDAESEKKHNETLAALREARALNEEIENLKLENVRLSARREILKRKSEELTEALERARRERSVLAESLKQDERDIDLEVVVFLLVSKVTRAPGGIGDRVGNALAMLLVLTASIGYGLTIRRKYEDTLRELADNFRSTSPIFFGEIAKELEALNEINSSFLNEEKKLQDNVSELKRELTRLQTDVPEDILAIIGRTGLEKKIIALFEKCEMLNSKRDSVLKNQPSTSSQ